MKQHHIRSLVAFCLLCIVYTSTFGQLLPPKQPFPKEVAIEIVRSFFTKFSLDYFEDDPSVSLETFGTDEPYYCINAKHYFAMVECKSRQVVSFRDTYHEGRWVKRKNLDEFRNTFECSMLLQKANQYATNLGKTDQQLLSTLDAYSPREEPGKETTISVRFDTPIGGYFLSHGYRGISLVISSEKPYLRFFERAMTGKEARLAEGNITITREQAIKIARPIFEKFASDHKKDPETFSTIARTEIELFRDNTVPFYLIDPTLKFFRVRPYWTVELVGWERICVDAITGDVLYNRIILPASYFMG